MENSRGHSNALPDFKNKFVGPLIVALSFVALAQWTWLKGGDLFTDFGHQLYNAWRLSEGEVLYRDIVWIFGPLSHTFNSFIFGLTGVAASHLLIANLFIIAALSAAIFSLALRVSDRLTATLTALTVLVIFCFGHLIEEGTFNFLTPYSHEATHGLLACVFLIYFCDRWIQTHSPFSAIAAGTCVGFTLLTKIELALAASVISLVFLAGAKLLKLRPHKINFFLLGAVIPPLGFFLFFLFDMAPSEAFKATFGTFSIFFRAGLSSVSEFYQLQALGLDRWQANLWTVSKMFLLGALGVAVLFGLDILFSRIRLKIAYAFAAATVLFGILYLKSSIFPWFDAPRLLTFFCPLLGLVLLRYVLQNPLSTEQKSRALLGAMWIGLSIVLLVRLGLRARFYHYGFFLALPATVSLVVVCVYYVPTLLVRFGAQGTTFRTCIAAFCLATLVVHIRFSDHYYSQRIAVIGHGTDRIYLLAPSTSQSTASASNSLTKVREVAKSSDTLSVVPCGGLLNYFLRLKNPTGLPVLDLNVIRLAGEEEILKRFQTSQPRLLLITSLDEREVGVGTLGQDARFAPKLWNWVQEHYTLAARIPEGDTPPYAQLLTWRR